MPLSTSGLCVQMLSSLATFRRERGRCTENDCKVVLNHLIRAFSQPLKKQQKQQFYRSRNVIGCTGKPVRDHAVPVNELMKLLLSLPESSLEITDDNVTSLDSLLSQSLVLVEITPGENAKLNEGKLQSKMPDGWSDPGHRYYKDPWARYKAVNIYESIEV